MKRACLGGGKDQLHQPLPMGHQRRGRGTPLNSVWWITYDLPGPVWLNGAEFKRRVRKRIGGNEDDLPGLLILQNGRRKTEVELAEERDGGEGELLSIP